MYKEPLTSSSSAPRADRLARLAAAHGLTPERLLSFLLWEFRSRPRSLRLQRLARYYEHLSATDPHSLKDLFPHDSSDHALPLYGAGDNDVVAPPGLGSIPADAY